MQRLPRWQYDRKAAGVQGGDEARRETCAARRRERRFHVVGSAQAFGNVSRVAHGVVSFLLKSWIWIRRAASILPTDLYVPEHDLVHLGDFP